MTRAVPFMGRSRELSAVDDRLAALAGGVGALVLVEGEAGLGKTQLLREIEGRARQRAYWTLWGTGSAGPVQTPFQILDETAQSVAARLAPAGEQAGRLRAALQPFARELGALFPPLRRALASKPGAQEPGGGANTLAALRALLSCLGTAEQPAVLLLDDCQWAGDLTDIIGDYWREAGRRLGHVLLIAASRSGAVAFRQLPADLRLELEPLSRPQVAQIARALDGSIDGEQLEQLVTASAGNPFMAQALAQAQAESRPSPEGEPRPPRRIAEYLVGRLAQLAPATLRLLSAGAVLGRRFDLAEAAHLAGAPASGALISAREAERRNLLSIDEPQAQVAIAHDLIREALLGQLSEGERRQLHERAAELIAAGDRPASLQLAFHWEASGRPDRALPHAMAAAEQAQAQAAPRLAQSCWEIAERAAAEHPPELRAQIAEGLGQVLMLNGAYESSRSRLKAALALARDARSRSRIQAHLGELAFKQGDMTEATQATEEALRLLGIEPPPTPGRAIAGAIGQAIIQALHTAFPALLVGRKDPGRADGALEAARLLYRLQYPYYFQGRVAAAGWANLRALNLAERYRPSAELGLVYATHAVQSASLPRLRRALRFARRAVSIERGLGRVWEEGVALGYLAFVLIAATRYGDAATCARKAVRILRDAGDPWERNDAQVILAIGLGYLGDLEAGQEAAEAALAAARAIGDAHTVAAAQLALARMTGGRLPAELTPAQHRGDQLAEIHQLQARAVWSLARGEPAAASALLGAADQLARRTGARDQFVAPLYPLRASALRQQLAQAAPRGLPKGLRREARRAARQGLRWAKRFPTSLPLALREAGQLAALEGRPRRARRLLDRSLDVARAQGARLQAAHTLAARGAVGLALGWPGASDDLARGERELSSLGSGAAPPKAAGALEPEAPLERREVSADLVATARTLLTSHSWQAGLDRLCELARTLLGAEQCAALDGRSRERDGFLERWAGDPDLAVHMDVARGALSQGRAAAVPEPLSPDASSAEALADPRWHLYLPIPMLGRPAVCLAIARQSAFGERELQLGELLSALGGATLENIEGFAQVETLAQSLESQLQEDHLRLERVSRQLESREDVLRRAEEDLVRVDRLSSLGLLAAGLAHELRNPLSVILGYAEVLLKKSAGDRALREPLLAIERQAQRTLNLVRLLLEQSRARQGELEWLAPRELLERVVELERGRALHSRVRLRIALAEPLPVVQVVPDKALSVLLNLVNNAFDATAQGGEIVLNARARERAQEPGIEFSVADTGAGIPPETLSRVFEPFFTTKPAGQGTGLGLSLVRRLTEEHGGRVEIESAPGKGTVVRIWLPRSAPERPGGLRAGDAPAQSA